MTATGSFKRFRVLDLIVILISAGLFWLVSFAATSAFAPQTSYIASLLAASILVGLTANIIGKTGSAILFYLAVSLLAFRINDIGATGIDKVITLFIAGMVFEIIFLIFKVEIGGIQLDIIAATALSVASIPITASLLLSVAVTASNIYTVTNLVLLAFFMGVLGAVASSLIWSRIKHSRFLLKFFIYI
ncbi:MAG TPA: hypothetical protein VJI46_04300 [Candidatus Nanoarchaeia archaeon]|nr:hypothetical protein [Candidatus Nanoarchaeia archaeon]